ncbi:MAG: hypothetical protein ACW98Y_13490 [Candidatus Thorarchaeota archaeon]|jgi:hypothetical protein
METEKLLQELCRKVGDYEPLEFLEEYDDLDMCSFRSSRPLQGEVLTEVTGPWFSIVANIAFEGTTMDPSTDRASGDPYSAIVRYNWVGLIDALPKKKHVTIVDLDKWAIHKSWYSREYTSTGSWGQHKGSWVTGIEEDGTLSYREVESKYFQDASPESTTIEKTILLEESPGK